MASEKDTSIVVPATDAEQQAPHHVDSDTASTTSEKFQPGVQRARATASVWGTKTLYTMFALLYLINFVNSLLSSVQSSLNAYITSSFKSHGLLSTLDVLSTILSGCTQLALAKIADVFGRAESFSSMLLITIVGLIMKAFAKNIQTYVAAHVLYWTGYVGQLYVVSVMMADMTSLRNRMIVFGLNATPTICSTFAGPKIAMLYYNHLNFRWAFGSFAIILAGVSLPMVALLFISERKARAQGLIPPNNSGRTVAESLKYYAIEFDIVGLIIIIAAWAFLLLPFSLVGYSPHGWKTGYIIAFIIVGALLFPVFYIWESRYATVQFLPWRYLRDPTIIGSCLLYAVMFLSTYTWDTYLYSYVQVVNRLNIATAGYVINSYGLSSAIISPFAGWLIHKTGNFKWVAMSGVPMMLIGTGLLIPFRHPGIGRGWIVLTQVLVGIGAGFFSMCGQLAVMVPVTHQEVASVLAVYGMFGSLGASIGIAIAGGIWNNTLFKGLLKRLPTDLKSEAMTIYGSIVVQMSFPDGSSGRKAVVGAYGATQRYMVIAGACFMPFCLLSIWMWRNVNVKKLEAKGTQTKGNVF
ncbi:hypothetical protein TD95_002451 [Thielaviopsis punctulata]|uniref:Major facilitator superfamily (MFS) profile domain-containing protein n=1 Tax=Thielaviopsis punctulata TaxID=72032 RepID=A0A0F4ZAJ3_9PEZI|nr:hypothetical protein TD95_002451 [Thielaviopsis punctulata]